MLKLYSLLLSSSTPALKMLLRKRCRKGKEDPTRINERMGNSSIERPNGKLVWLHGASVGEAQSMLILIDALLESNPQLNILVTTGTVTSAELMGKRLPKSAIHQYIPLDHPRWIARFLDHWKPDMALWMESELWPNTLQMLTARKIPAALVNARLSESSYKRWKKRGNAARKILNSFSICLAQTEDDGEYFSTLGMENVVVSDNLKYSSAPLPIDKKDFESLKSALSNRPVWLYSSTHQGEEEIACRIHRHLKQEIPDLLTMIVPRHPERRDEIIELCEKFELKARRRGQAHNLPKKDDDVYIGDTLGELGLFYRTAPIACIGRSLSNDGGGGHNPIEAAQLDCAVLHGPHIQNLQRIYDEIGSFGASIVVNNENKLQENIKKLLDDEESLDVLQNKASQFALRKAQVLERVLQHLEPLLAKAGLVIAKDIRESA